MSWEVISIILGGVLGVSGLVGIFWANTKNNLIKQQEANYTKTIDSYKGIVEAQDQKINFLTDEVKTLRDSHTDNVKMIGQLQGELKSWKELPIRELADHMGYVAELQFIMAKHLGIDHLPDMPTKKSGKA